MPGEVPRRCLSGLAALLCAAAGFAGRTFAADAPSQPHFRPDGRFKIVQFTDVHWNGDTNNAPKSAAVMTAVLDAEKPDLVALTGDIVTTTDGPNEKWNALLAPIVERKIPWAAVMGNHDDEKHGMKRRDLVNYLSTLPYSLVQGGPEALGGTGNYVVTVAGASGKPAAALYFIDSRAYPTIPAVKNDPRVPSRYGWISFDQILWYREASRQLRAVSGSAPLPALAFFHIPLPEYDNTILFKRGLIGTRKEGINCAALNTGLFAALLEEGDVMGVFVGHDHSNDYAGSLFGICLAYGRCSGFGGYGKLPRGGRVIELAEGKREFESWIRAGDGSETNRFSFPAAFEGKK